MKRKLKLSDLILLGVKLDGPQITDEMFATDENWDREYLNYTVTITGTCALGAAILAKKKLKIPTINFKKLDPKEFSRLEKTKLPTAMVKIADLPKNIQEAVEHEIPITKKGRKVQTMWLVPYLNDGLRLSRQEIARILAKAGA